MLLHPTDIVSTASTSSVQSELKKRIELYNTVKDAIFELGIVTLFYLYSPFRLTCDLALIDAMVMELLSWMMQFYNCMLDMAMNRSLNFLRFSL